MKKIYSILFCLMAMSITFSSCSKGGDDDFLPNGGGTEVDGGSTQPLTEREALNNAYNSGNTTTFINALESKGCIAKVAQTRSGDNDSKYELTEKGKEYFKSDLFSVISGFHSAPEYIREQYAPVKAYLSLCWALQGIYWVENDEGEYEMQEDMYGKYKWVSLDNPNVWFECSHNGCLNLYETSFQKSDGWYKCIDIGSFYEEFVITYHTNNGSCKHKFSILEQIDKIRDLARRKVGYYNELFIFSQVMGTDNFYSSGGYDYTSSKNNICIANISTENTYDIVQGLYIRVPKTNK